MNTNKYIEISKSIDVPATVVNHFDDTMNSIKTEVQTNNKRKVVNIDFLNRFVAAAIALVLIAVTGISATAYINNRMKIKNTSDEEVIDLYENIFKDFKGCFSRELTEEELELETKCFNNYLSSVAAPKEQVKIIDLKSDYSGKGIAYCKEDGILYLPKRNVSEEEMLEIIEFTQFSLYIDYERYYSAIDIDYYLNDLRKLTSAEVDEIYLAYFGANTEKAFFSRELSDSENIKMRNYRKLYKSADKKPSESISIIDNKTNYTGQGVAFCKSDCTYYLPDYEMNEDEILKLIDFQIKAEYSFYRINEEIEDGLRTERPYIEYVPRDRVITLDSSLEADTNVMKLPWIKAYSDLLEQKFSLNKTMYGESAPLYYVNVCFIYLNDDDIPELLINEGCTDLDYDDWANIRNNIYTYQDGKAVWIKAIDETGYECFNHFAPFQYVEKKGLVLYDFYHTYNLKTINVANDEIDFSSNKKTSVISFSDDLMSYVKSNDNIFIEHSVVKDSNPNKSPNPEDGEYSEEYYINVTDIVSENGLDVIKGEKVSKEDYFKANESLWNGEQYHILSVSDFDKIYLDDNYVEALAKVYQKKNNY